VQTIDQRIVKVSVEIGVRTHTYQDLYISARGMKYANALQNECEITILNLNKQTRDYLLTETSPFNTNYVPKTITLEAGRQSYGTFRVYVGNVVAASVSQPPDIGITLKCLTGNFQKGNIIARNQPSQVSLSQVAKQVAKDLGTYLTFQAADKSISNFSFAGAALKQVEHLAFSGGVNVFIDDNTLVVKDQNVPLNNIVTVVNQNTGMVGIPELTEQGIRVVFLLDNRTVLGGTLRVSSVLNPAVNGDYVVYKLGFDIANRNDPFYYIAEAARRR
jgi:hypothetical protein